MRRAGFRPDRVPPLATISPQSSVLSPQSSVLGPQSSVLSPQSSVISHQSSSAISHRLLLVARSSLLTTRHSLISIRTNVLHVQHLLYFAVYFAALHCCYPNSYPNHLRAILAILPPLVATGCHWLPLVATDCLRRNGLLLHSHQLSPKLLHLRSVISVVRAVRAVNLVSLVSVVSAVSVVSVVRMVSTVSMHSPVQTFHLADSYSCCWTNPILALVVLTNPTILARLTSERSSAM